MADDAQTDMPDPSASFLDGQILIAMPSMEDPRFQRTLVYLCAHSSDGAMGLVINRDAGELTFSTLLEKLGIDATDEAASPVGAQPVRYGGPCDPSRGFVLHSADYSCDQATLAVDDDTGMTATLDVLRAIADGRGPERAIIALGYAGWAPGQLEAELRQNGWLCCAADHDLLFGADQSDKWDRALAKLGISPAMLNATGGSA